MPITDPIIPKYTGYFSIDIIMIKWILGHTCKIWLRLNVCVHMQVLSYHRVLLDDEQLAVVFTFLMFILDLYIN